MTFSRCFSKRLSRTFSYQFTLRPVVARALRRLLQPEDRECLGAGSRQFPAQGTGSGFSDYSRIWLAYCMVRQRVSLTALARAYLVASIRGSGTD